MKIPTICCYKLLYLPSVSPSLSQVLGGGAAEEGAWPESPTVGGHLQVSLVESVTAGYTAFPGGKLYLSHVWKGVGGTAIGYSEVFNAPLNGTAISSITSNCVAIHT